VYEASFEKSRALSRILKLVSELRSASTVNLQIITDAERGQSLDIGYVIDPQVLLTCDSTREQAEA
jgi:hypothetical protein